MNKTITIKPVILLGLLWLIMHRAWGQNIPDTLFFPIGYFNNMPVPPNPHSSVDYSRVVKKYPRYPVATFGALDALDSTRTGKVIEVKDGFNRTIQTRQVRGAKSGSQFRDIIQLQDNRHIKDRYGFLPYSIATDYDYIDRQSYTNQRSYNISRYPGNSYTSYSMSTNISDATTRGSATYLPGKNFVGLKVGGDTTLLLSAGADLCRRWYVDGAGLPVNDGYYYGLSISFTEVRNSNSREQLFTDRDGRLLRKSVQDSAGTWQTTYYVYDDLGKLCYIIPPKATELINLYTLPTDVRNNLCFQYRYDDKGRLMAERKPGEADFTEMVYDAYDRIVMRQTALEKTGNQWEVLYYDNYDRPIATSLYTSSHDRAYWQNLIDNVMPPSADTALMYYLSHETGLGTAPVEGAISGNMMMSYLYYDNYLEADQSGLRVKVGNKHNIWAEELSSAQVQGAEPPTPGMLRANGMATGSRTRIVHAPGADTGMTGTWKTDLTWYDRKGRVGQTLMLTTAGTDTLSESYFVSQYDFLNRTILSKHILVNNRSADGMDEHTERIRNYYDEHTGFHTHTTHKVNGGGWFPLVTYTYDDMGRVSREVLGQQGEFRDYTYNIRGQLEGINAHYAATGNKQGQNRTFGEKLHYDEGFATNRFDGKIAGMIWRGTTAGNAYAYGYIYDMSGRLKAADFRHKMNAGAWQNTTTDYSVSNLHYDKNGNLLSMNQRSTYGTSPYWMDVMSYTYAPNSNELIAIADTVTTDHGKMDFRDGNTGNDDYEYDASGNLTKDKNKGITSVTYTHFNKPQAVTFANGNKILYSYTAGGATVQELHITDSTSDTSRTDNIANFIYKNDSLSYALTSHGRTIIDTDNNGLGKEEFFVKDHLGNIRSVIDYYRTTASTYLGTYEVASAHVEGLIFNNHVFISDLNPDPVPGDVMAGLLNGGDPDYRTGSALLLQVMSGDKIDMSVEGLYDLNDLEDMGSPADWYDMFDALTGALMSGTGGTGMGEGAYHPGMVGELLQPNVYMEFIQQMQDSLADTTKPMAFLNYVFFDENNQVVPESSGFIQLTSDGNWQAVGLAEVLELDMNGHIAIWLSNATSVNVFVNNLTVSVTKGNLLEENHYYPHGQRWAWYKRNGHKDQKRSYQSNEYREEFGLHWMDFNARQYDAQTGRFLGIDPLASSYGQEMYSPYAAMGNAPSINIDPNGESFQMPAVLSVRSAGGVETGWEGLNEAFDRLLHGGSRNSQVFAWLNNIVTDMTGGGGGGYSSSSEGYSGLIGQFARVEIMKGFSLAMAGNCAKYSFSVPLGGAGGNGNAQEPDYGFTGPMQPGDEDPQQNDEQSGSKPLPKGLGPYVSSNPLLTSNGENTYTWEEFVAYNQGLTYKEIVNQREESSGAPGGPELRYVVNPKDFKVMDMRHVLVVGYHYGLLVGHTVEAAQFLKESTRPSSFNRQDYYSNQIGYDFYHFSRTPHASEYKGFINKMNDFMLYHQIPRHLRKD